MCMKGRNISKEKAVRNPTAPEVFGVVIALGFDCILEDDEAYSRDGWVIGRICTKLFSQHHQSLHHDIPSRKLFPVTSRSLSFELVPFPFALRH